MWSFDESRHRLLRGDAERRLEPKVATVLATLVERQGEVVTKQELLDAAWPHQYVSEEVLTNAVYQLRKALDDDAREPRFIETIPKGGYRLMTPLALPSPAASPRSSGRPVTGAGVGRKLVLASSILIVVLGLQSSSSPASPRVSELIEHGREAIERNPGRAFREAEEAARQALALDPDHADAWVLMASAQLDRGREAGDWHAALRAAERALVLQPGHPGALSVRARARWLGSWDWQGAEQDLRAALESDPKSPERWAELAELLLFSGRLDEAHQSVARALERAPDSVGARMTAAAIARFAGDDDAASRHYRRVLALAPGHGGARAALAKLDPQASSGTSRERVARLAAKGRLRPGHMALWFLEDGDEDAALAWLERAVEERDPTLLYFRFDRRWDRLREHARYRAAMAAARVPSGP